MFNLTSSQYSATYVAEIWRNISDKQTFNVSYYNPDYSNVQDSGTCHISVLSPEGDAVTVTTLVDESQS